MEQHYPFTLPPLPYAYDALAPELIEKVLYFHHDKHFAAYVETSYADNSQHPIKAVLQATCYDQNKQETIESDEGNVILPGEETKLYTASHNFEPYGLEVEAIGHRPGVFSARYANMPDSFEESGFVSPESLQMPDPTFDQNIDRLLFKLENKPRKARFRSVICLILNNQTYYFEGCVNGIILPGRHGSQGFGYDPVFQPEGFEKSFAELDMAEKNAISHRGKAVQALIAFLEKTGKEAWTGQTASITPTN